MLSWTVSYSVVKFVSSTCIVFICVVVTYVSEEF